MKKYNILWLLMGFSFLGFGQGSETFTNLNADGNQYSNGSFVGDGEITWTYSQARKITSTYVINGTTIGFDDSGDRYVKATVSGGVGSVTYSVRSYWTSGDETNRTIELWVDGAMKESFTLSAMETVFTRTVSDINISGFIDIEFKSTGTKQIALDDVIWTGYGPPNPTNFSIDHISSTKMQLSWTAPVDPYDKVLIFGRDGAAVDHFPSGTGLDYFDSDANWGDAGTYDNSKLLYIGTDTDITITGLTEGADYYYKAYTFVGFDWSSGIASIPSNAIAEVQGTTDFTAVAGDLQATLSWTNPSLQGEYWDEVLILAKAGSAVDAIPTGDGSSYTASAVFANGTQIGAGNYAVYKGTGVAEVVTALTSGIEYHFQTFVRHGSDWTPVGLTQVANCTLIDIPQLMITEIMTNPAAVPDGDGEWFEIYNHGSTTVDIDGFVLKDNGADSHTINNGGPLNIEAGSFLVLGNNVDNVTNGGLTVHYQYTSFTLANTADEIVLYATDGSTEVDRVEWYDGSGGWPLGAGESMIYTASVGGDNNNPSNWAEAALREPSFTGVDGDYGSPGSEGTGQQLTTNTPGLWKTIASSSDWNSGDNWDDGIVPSVSTDVVIPFGAGNYPIITGIAAECNHLTMAGGSSLTIAVDGALTVHGTFTNNGGAGAFTVQSSATGNGSFIPNAVSGDVTIERFVIGHDNVDADGWHLISQPVNDASFDVAGSDFQPGVNDDLYWWNETQYIWKNYKAGAFDFDIGKGYLCSFETTALKSFYGVPNAETVTVSGLTNTSGVNEDGWNLLGNPYASAIIWNGTGGAWGLHNVGAVIQVYNSTNRNYQAVIANGIIPAMQGFFVQVNDGTTGNVTIPKSSRIADNTAWLKSDTVIENGLELRVSGGGVPYYDKTLVRFHDDATNGFDPMFDGNKIFGFAETPSLYTMVEEEMFSVNTQRPQQDEMIVPLAFLAGVNGEFTIEVQSNTVNTVGNIYLEDKVNDQMINLSTQSSYTFNASTTHAATRFLLHFNGVTDVEDLTEVQGPLVYALDDYVYISSQEYMDAQVMIYNTNGQLVGQDRMHHEQLKRIAVKASPGIYLVYIQSMDALYTEKVYIK